MKKLLSNLQTHNLLEGIEDTAVVHISKGNIVQDANDLAIKTLKLTPSSFNKCNFIEHCVAYSFGVSALFANKLASKNNLIRESYTLDTGEFICLLWKKVPLQNVSNLKHDFLLMGFDVTAEKESISHYKETIFFYETILSKLPTNVYWKDEHGVYMGCNDRLAYIMGLPSREAIKGMTDYDFDWGPNAAEKFIAFDKKVMTTGQSLTTEDIFKEASGKVVTVLTNKTPLKNKAGKTVGVLAISVDITDRKQMESDLKNAKEAAEAANQAKTEFLENMRHDIRTPLTGIVGFSDILKMEAKDLQIKEYADNLVASSHALLDLLDEVLEAIRVSSGEIPKLKKKFDLKKNLETIIALNRAKAAEKRIDLSLQFSSEIPPYVIGDKIRIHRVALELVGNALNFTDRGHVKLSAELAKKDNQDLVIKLTVEDTGIGIPKEKQHEIYVQFKRLTPSYKGIYKGTGLGLSVVKQFIDELDAEIYVESEPKKGSRFTCFIPLQEPLVDSPLGLDELDEDTAKYYETPYAHQIKSPIPDANTKEYRVLVVEDNSIAQSVAKSILSQSHCKVDIAECGKKAVEMWKTNVYDLIFMDIGLPDIDGYEVTHVIRVQELPKKTHVPIIALTAHAGDENKKRCIDAGMNAVLTKPLTAKSCADIVDAFIPGRTLPESTPTSIAGKDLPDTEEGLFNLNPYPPLDIDEGIRTTGDEKMLTEMLRILVEGELQKDLDAMKQAFAENNFEKTQELAHKIKGGAVYVGTVKMKMACQYLERYWKAGHRDLFEKLYQQAVGVIEETIREVKQWLENR